ncbi:hypothetical protein HPP92_022806 [Vanilla planifolia]|uniref:Myb/SANT-like DNA-binding domain-containing protein n=1 Tax=Vanilla planifolia TaxID=51239 RepID=A0A835PYZ8_VANPL|nr:hypothetical protein HPP92_022806 [Vanilla planifolia]
MASCDDDFSLLGDDAQSHPHSQQQQASAPVANSGSIPFPSSRYVSKASVTIHSRSLPLSSVVNPRKGPFAGAGEHEDPEGFGEAFASTDVNAHHHCFADDDHGSNPFGTAHPPDDCDADGDNNTDCKSRDPSMAVTAAHHHHHPLADPKRKDRDELSDGESPYGYGSGIKRSRPSSVAPSSSGDYRKDREEWSDSAIGCLLDAYTDKYIQLNRGNLRGRDWEDVATTVSERCDKQKSGKTVEQCKNKVDNLKKRYKVECQRLSSGNLAVSHWPWFKKMEQIVGSSSSSKAGPEDDKVIALTGSTPATRQMKRYPVTSPGSTSLTSSFKLKTLPNPRWKRVVLKISGAALAGTGPQNVDPKVTMLIAREVAMASRVGVEVAIVVGGRNFFCGDAWLAATGTDRTTTYQIGSRSALQRGIFYHWFDNIRVVSKKQFATHFPLER